MTTTQRPRRYVTRSGVRQEVPAVAERPAPPQPKPVAKVGKSQAVAGTEPVIYEDETGRIWTVLVPVGHPDEAAMGLVVGPPDLSHLSLPESIAVRLHNELHARGLLTLRDLKGREVEVQAALSAAMRVDTQTIISAYRQ